MSEWTHRRIRLVDAQAFTEQYHRHSPPLQRHAWTTAAYWNGEIQGIVTVDRPSSAYTKYDFIAEIRRLVTKPDAVPNTASFLMGKAKQACFAIGYDLLVSYTKGYENGASLKAAGFMVDKWWGEKLADGSCNAQVRWYVNKHEPVGPEERRQTEEMLLDCHFWLNATESRDDFADCAEASVPKRCTLEEAIKC